MLRRCWNTKKPIHVRYHDEEWGVPLHDDQRLFEFLVLGGFQAGLTWWLILERREAFRQAFDRFDIEKVAQYGSGRIEQLMKQPRIIRNKAKITAAINNASKVLAIQEDFGSFDAFIWSFVDKQPIQNFFSSLAELPAETEQSRAMSKELKMRGFQFVGPTICYAFMQATGMVNDHLVGCFRHKELRKLDYIG